MDTVFWIVVFLLSVVHLLLHVVIRKESKLVFWLSVAFDVTFVSSAAILFEHHYGDWSASGQVKLLVMVITYAVVDQFFARTVWQLQDHVEQVKINAAVSAQGTRHAEEIIKARDSTALAELFDQKLETRAEAKAQALINSRDAEEFSRLRQECLDKLIQRDFDKRLHEALESDAHKQLIARRLEEEKWARSSDTEKALWIALSGTSKTLADHFGVGEPSPGFVFAIPYWVYYDNKDGKPKTLRFSSVNASVVKATDAAFVSNRWNKVEGSNEIVLDGAIIRAPRV